MRDEAVAVSDTSGPSVVKDVLIIDDDVEIGELIARVARDAGFSPTVLADPVEFKRLFAEVRPSVVTIDILMPKIDGIELVAWVAERRLDVRILVVSGSDPLYGEIIDLMASSHGAQAVHFLPKPVDVEALGKLLVSP